MKKKNVLKEGGNCGIKKSRGFCLFLSVAIIFWGVWGSAFLASVSGAGEDLGVVRPGFWLPNRPNPLYHSFFLLSFLLLFLKRA